MSIINKEKFQKIKKLEKEGKKNTIMLVDDNVELLKEINSLLSGDYEVITAVDGREALDLVKNMERPGRIALIISDQGMPGLTGMELFERLIKIIPHTKRILLTVVDDKEFILKSINKIYDYVLKPFEPGEFKFIVKRAVDAYELHQELVKASIIDYLTGLWNRRYIVESIKHEIARVDREYENWKRGQSEQLSSKNNLCFMMLDIDYFRSVNNKHGHHAGDMVLKQLGEILRKNCRESDTVGRWGGEEFLLISCPISREETLDLAERIRESVEKHHFNVRDGLPPLHITCSIGFSVYPFLTSLHHTPREHNWEELINIADIALYTAKKSNRNAWVGFLGTEKARPGNLYRRILEDINRLIDTGEIKVVSSLPQKDLVWEGDRQENKLSG
jgi:diguanylate cyclase (GGDEF)-like protein